MPFLCDYVNDCGPTPGVGNPTNLPVGTILMFAGSDADRQAIGGPNETWEWYQPGGSHHPLILAAPQSGLSGSAQYTPGTPWNGETPAKQDQSHHPLEKHNHTVNPSSFIGLPSNNQIVNDKDFVDVLSGDITLTVPKGFLLNTSILGFDIEVPSSDITIDTKFFSANTEQVVKNSSVGISGDGETVNLSIGNAPPQQDEAKQMPNFSVTLIRRTA